MLNVDADDVGAVRTRVSNVTVAAAARRASRRRTTVSDVGRFVDTEEFTNSTLVAPRRFS
jgi:hypothetical protein